MTARSDAVVGRSFLKLGAGEALARLIAFGATVYLARLLGAGVYGIIVLATAILLYASCLTDCGIEQLGVRDIAHDRSKLGVVLPEYLGARLLVAAILIVLLVGVGLLVFPQPDGAVLAIYAFLLLPTALGVRWVHLGLEQSGRAAVARVLGEGVAALLIVVLVRGPEDVTHAPLAQILGESAATFLLLRLLPKGSGGFRPVVRPDVLRPLVRRAWPVVGHTLLGLLLFNSDFFFLRIYRDSATVGYYAVAYTLVSFFLNLGSSYALSLLPVLTRLRTQPAAERSLYESAMAQVFAGALPIAIGGSLLATRVMALVFGGGYAASGRPLQILVWSIPFAMFRNVTQGALVARGRQDKLFRAAGWATGLNLLLNATVIPFWGMAGAALVTVVTEAARTGLALRYCRLAGLPFPSLRRFWRTLISGTAMACVLGIGGMETFWAAMVVGAVVYALTLYLVGGVKLVPGALPELTV